LAIQNLETLRLAACDIEPRDAVELLRKHEESITKLDLKEQKLLKSSDIRDCFRPQFPWSNVLLAMRAFKNKCQVTIIEPREESCDPCFQPPWEDWDWDWDGEYVYKGLTIGYVDVEDEVTEDYMCGDYTYICIQGDDDWQNGVERVCTFYLTHIMRLEAFCPYIMKLKEIFEDAGNDTLLKDPGDDYWDAQFKKLVLRKQTGACLCQAAMRESQGSDGLADSVIGS
jgi:hypothetical protein